MRAMMVVFFLATLACDKSGPATEGGQGQAGNETLAKPVAPGEPAAKEPESPNARVTGEPQPAPACDEWLSQELISNYCGAEPKELAANSVLPDDDRSCRRIAKLDDGRVEIVISKSGTSKQEWKNTILQFPAEPIWEVDRNRRRAKVSAFPYFISVNQRKSDGAELACTEPEALALVGAIAAKLPTGKAPEVAMPNARCQKLLTAADVQELCGQAITTKPTPMEDGDKVYCNRVGGGMNGIIFIISQHRDAVTAQKAEEVASGNDTVATTVHDAYLVELKSRDAMGKPAACKPEQLRALALRVGERLALGE